MAPDQQNHRRINFKENWPAWSLLAVGICGLLVIAFQRILFHKPENLQAYIESKGLEVETAPFSYLNIDDTEFLNPELTEKVENKQKNSNPQPVISDSAKPKYFHERLSSEGNLLEDSIALQPAKILTHVLLSVNTPYGTVYIPYSDSTQNSSMPKLPELPPIDPIRP